jgi:hypothetical protein
MDAGDGERAVMTAAFSSSAARLFETKLIRVQRQRKEVTVGERLRVGSGQRIGASWRR